MPTPLATIGDFHIQNIYTKLQVHSKSEAATKVLRHRLTRWAPSYQNV